MVVILFFVVFGFLFLGGDAPFLVGTCMFDLPFTPRTRTPRMSASRRRSLEATGPPAMHFDVAPFPIKTFFRFDAYLNFLGDFFLVFP